MMRVSVCVAFGLTALLIAPSFATAQVAPGAASAKDLRLLRGFQGVTFDSGTSGTTKPAWSSPRHVLPSQFQDRDFVPPPMITVAPKPHGTGPACIRVAPVDPNATSNMPTVKVDGRIDPKMLIKAPECQPSSR